MRHLTHRRAGNQEGSPYSQVVMVALVMVMITPTMMVMMKILSLRLTPTPKQIYFRMNDDWFNWQGSSNPCQVIPPLTSKRRQRFVNPIPSTALRLTNSAPFSLNANSISALVPAHSHRTRTKSTSLSPTSRGLLLIGSSHISPI